MSDIRRRPISRQSQKRIQVSNITKSPSVTVTQTSDQYIQKYTYATRKRQKELINSNKNLNSSHTNTNITSSDEFKLLCKLYFPRYQKIVTENRLIEILPRIICTTSTTTITDKHKDEEGSKFNQLNYQLHLFLANITSKYINSWYSHKLNTEDFEFIHVVYKNLCHVTRALIKRFVSYIINDADKFMKFSNEFIDILNLHISEVTSMAYLDTFKNSNIVLDDAKLNEDCMNLFLSQRHVIFLNLVKQEEAEVKGEVEGDEDNAEICDELENSHEEMEEGEEVVDQSFFPAEEYIPSSEIVYFRVLSKNIVDILFKEEPRDSCVNPLTPIGEGLVISILGDLIFMKVLDSFANPHFLLGLIDLVVDKLEDDKGKGKQQVKQHRINLKQLLDRALNIVSYASGYISNFYSCLFPSTSPLVHGKVCYPVFNSSIFKLLNTITKFSHKNPLVSGFFQTIQSLILSNSYMSQFLDSNVKKYLGSKIFNFEFLTDESLAEVVAKLRKSLFSSEQEEEDKKKRELDDARKEVDITELSERLYEILHKKLPSIMKNTDKGEFLGSATEILEVFAERKLNSLLIIQWLDLIVGSLLPELVQAYD